MNMKFAFFPQYPHQNGDMGAQWLSKDLSNFLTIVQPKDRSWILLEPLTIRFCFHSIVWIVEQESLIRTSCLESINLAKASMIFFYLVQLKAFLRYGAVTAQDWLVSITSSAIFVIVLIALTIILAFWNPTRLSKGSRYHLAITQTYFELPSSKKLPVLFNMHRSIARRILQRFIWFRN